MMRGDFDSKITLREKTRWSARTGYGALPFAATERYSYAKRCDVEK
jgi:hypothetical protein